MASDDSNDKQDTVSPQHTDAETDNAMPALSGDSEQEDDTTQEAESFDIEGSAAEKKKGADRLALEASDGDNETKDKDKVSQ